MWTTPVGARPARRDCPCRCTIVPRRSSTDTATRWRASTPAWTSKSTTKMLRSRCTKLLVFVLCLAPLGWMIARALGWTGGTVIVAVQGFHVSFNGGFFDALGNLTLNPLEYITHYTGDWTIRMIVIGLTVTPLRKLLHLPDLIR